MSMQEKTSSEEKENKKKKKKKSKVHPLVKDFMNALIEKIRGKSIKKQLAFLLDPDRIETSSRLKRNEVMAITQADWLGRTFERFEPLRAFWIGIAKEGGYARWIISEGGKGRLESIHFMEASTEAKFISPVIAPKKEEKKKE